MKKKCSKLTYGNLPGKEKQPMRVLTAEEGEGLRGWTRWRVLVWSGCQRLSSGLEKEASDEEQVQEA